MPWNAEVVDDAARGDDHCCEAGAASGVEGSGGEGVGRNAATPAQVLDGDGGCRVRSECRC